MNFLDYLQDKSFHYAPGQVIYTQGKVPLCLEMMRLITGFRLKNLHSDLTVKSLSLESEDPVNAALNLLNLRLLMAKPTLTILDLSTLRAKEFGKAAWPVSAANKKFYFLVFLPELRFDSIPEPIVFGRSDDIWLRCMQELLKEIAGLSLQEAFLQEHLNLLRDRPEGLHSFVQKTIYADGPWHTETSDQDPYLLNKAVVQRNSSSFMKAWLQATEKESLLTSLRYQLLDLWWLKQLISEEQRVTILNLAQKCQTGRRQEREEFLVRLQSTLQENSRQQEFPKRVIDLLQNRARIPWLVLDQARFSMAELSLIATEIDQIINLKRMGQLQEINIPQSLMNRVFKDSHSSESGRHR